MEADNDNPGELLLGACAIAKFLGVTKRQTYRLIEDRLVPSFKIGGMVAARRSTLTKWIETQERYQAA